MGSFSWLKAERTTKVANIVCGKPFKFLIPKEFGGGYIKEYYQDYGNLGTKEDGEPKYDMYELLALWNYSGDSIITKQVYDHDIRSYKDITFDITKFPKMKEVDPIYTDIIRSIGIDMTFDDDESYLNLKYPLKLVSASYNKTYEECEGVSISDPEQGFYQVTWTEHDKHLEEMAAYRIRLKEDNLNKAETLLRTVRAVLKLSNDEKGKETLLSLNQRVLESKYKLSKEEIDQLTDKILKEELSNKEVEELPKEIILETGINLELLQLIANSNKKIQ